MSGELWAIKLDVVVTRNPNRRYYAAGANMAVPSLWKTYDGAANYLARRLSAPILRGATIVPLTLSERGGEKEVEHGEG